MRTLTIIRHGKAESDGPGRKDFNRALTSRGRKDVRSMAKLLANAPPPIDLIVSSPAKRARETAEIIADKLNFQHPILGQEEIYNAKANALLAALQNLPEDAQHIALVGHNPGMEGLVAGLSSGATHGLNVRMPPAAVATLRLEIYWWNQIRWGCGQLQMLIKPKVMRDK